jgi:hypothetical protein
MADYAAAAVQPIVQGLITVSAAGGTLTFTGRGAKLVPSLQASPAGIGRDNTNPQGVIVLTLDKGLPGNAGAVEPVPDVGGVPAAGPHAPLPRTLVSLRAPSPGNPTTLDSVAVAYGNFTVPAPADGSLTQVEVVLATSAGALTDPFPTGGVSGSDGFEVIVWEGVESP